MNQSNAIQPVQRPVHLQPQPQTAIVQYQGSWYEVVQFANGNIQYRQVPSPVQPQLERQPLSQSAQMQAISDRRNRNAFYLTVALWGAAASAVIVALIVSLKPDPLTPSTQQPISQPVIIMPTPSPAPVINPECTAFCYSK